MMKRICVLATSKELRTERIAEIADIIHNNEQKSREWYLKTVADVTAIYDKGNVRVDAELLDHAPKLKCVVTISVGHDNIDVEECRKRGIKVGYAGDILTEVTAETCVSILLASARRICESMDAAKRGEWSKTWSAFWMCGKTVADSTVGIFGLGRIGIAVANRLLPFGAKRIIYHNRSGRNPNAPKEWEPVGFDDLLEQSDFLVVTASATDDAVKRFGQKEFQKMKKDSIFVNVSRGKVVDTEALLEALRSGPISGAALDVTDPEPLPADHPLWKMPNCVITPHIGSAATVVRHRMLARGEENLLCGLNGRPMISPLC